MVGIYSSAFILILNILNNANAILGIQRPILLDPPESVNTLKTRISANLYFEQKIDHFNPIDTRTYQQRYHINEDYYNETVKNHVFLMLGGEGEATETWLNYGSWLDTAKQYGALLIYLEHRYYGLSQPFSDLSTANLQYLSAHQALEDAANFIEGINTMYNLSTPEAKWIVFGGSYGGTLAAWLRHKYPHLVSGAVSSSGPLEAVLDFNEYLQVVRNGLATHSLDCIANIKDAFAQLDELTSNCLEDAAIYQEIDELFQLCESIETSEGNEKDLATLFEYLADNIFAFVVQYNGTLNNLSINTICDVMTSDTESTTNLQKLSQINSLILNYTNTDCIDYKYASLVASWQNTTIVASSMMRQWVYQTCTEFGNFQTSTQELPIFGSRFPISYFTDLCVVVFGEQFNETLTSLGITATNNRYGATNIATKNIVYFHGTTDPWSVLGKLETTNDADDYVIVVDGAAHCMNMHAASETDSAALTAAREKIDNLVGQWLGVVSGDSDGSSSSMLSVGNSFTWICFSIVLYFLN
ncbi:unnamed protein product [Ceutorhynchus assimilis]|uniref:Serine protease K12H4.7 n=1 Tax=Ceutorhynchus assimilis TaxID=467358 RepID=A0A9N9MV92_9CUCU|nr:unnamed protein product [Ceutorhynchus assimilis]